MTNELSESHTDEHGTIGAATVVAMIEYRRHLEHTHEVPGPIPSHVNLVQLIGLHQRMHEQEREDAGVPEGEPVFEHFAAVGSVEGDDGRWLPDFPAGPLGKYPLIAICGHCGASIRAEQIGMPWEVVVGSAPDPESYMNDLAWQQEYVDHLQSAGEVEMGLGDFDGGVDA